MKNQVYRYSPNYIKHVERINHRVIGASFLGLIFGISLVMCSFRTEAQTDNTLVDLPLMVMATTQPTAIIKPTEIIEPTVVSTKIVIRATEVIKARYSKSPLLENNRLETAYNLLGQNDNKFKIFIAIAGIESGFGKDKSANDSRNAWGYICQRKNKINVVDCGWKSWDYSIKRFIELEGDNWLAKYDGSKESLNQYVGKGKYCASACTTYIKSLNQFINELSK